CCLTVNADDIVDSILIRDSKELIGRLFYREIIDHFAILVDNDLFGLIRRYKQLARRQFRSRGDRKVNVNRDDAGHTRVIWGNHMYLVSAANKEMTGSRTQVTALRRDT